MFIPEVSSIERQVADLNNARLNVSRACLSLSLSYPLLLGAKRNCECAIYETSDRRFTMATRCCGYTGAEKADTLATGEG